jgi:hypothetical protein
LLERFREGIGEFGFGGKRFDERKAGGGLADTSAAINDISTGAGEAAARMPPGANNALLEI